jgi:hypothetical protein
MNRLMGGLAVVILLIMGAIAYVAMKADGNG